MGPGDLQTAERHYKRVIDQLGLTDREGKDRLDGLYAADDAALIALADPMMGWNVVCDGETVRHHVNFNSLTISQQDILPGKRWCSRLLAVQGNLEVTPSTLSPQKLFIADIQISPQSRECWS